MSISIPDWIEKARKPDEIIRAAVELQQIDAPQAIEPLARLSRLSQGWLMILLNLMITILVALVSLIIATSVLLVGVRLIFTVINSFLITFFPDWMRLWWASWGILISIWLWSDHRLRGLLIDNRFALPLEEFTWIWVVLLWPFRALAGVLRLSVALSFLTLMLALPIIALTFTSQTWMEWKVVEPITQFDPLTHGFIAGATYLLFGLWVFSDNIRKSAPAHRPKLVKRKLVRFLLAAVIATGLGLLVRRVSPASQDLAGLLSGGIFFTISYRWFSVLAYASSANATWLEIFKVHISKKQIRFLKFTLFLLGLLGIGIVIIRIAENEEIIRSLIPGLWFRNLEEWFRHNVDTRREVYTTLEPWLASLIGGATVSTFALVYLTGWGIRLARPFAWPFFWLRSSAKDMVLRIRVRSAVRRAIRHHRQRNHRLVDGHGSRAICREHLARFEVRQTRLSYWRQWKYWQCPLCKSDQQAITRVRVMRGVFDQRMKEPLHQEGEILLVNLLNRSDNLPLDLREVYVVQVDNQYDLETFVITYQNFAPPIKVPKLKQIRLLIDPAAHLNENTERMLKRAFQI